MLFLCKKRVAYGSSLLTWQCQHEAPRTKLQTITHSASMFSCLLASEKELLLCQDWITSCSVITLAEVQRTKQPGSARQTFTHYCQHVFVLAGLRKDPAALLRLGYVVHWHDVTQHWTLAKGSAPLHTSASMVLRLLAAEKSCCSAEAKLDKACWQPV